MLHSTTELITLAASNSLIVFCFCNFIIATLILLAGSSSSSSSSSNITDSDMVEEETVTTVARRSMNERERLDSYSVEVSGESTETVEAYENAESEGEEEDNDELRKSIEEFIQITSSDVRREETVTTVGCKSMNERERLDSHSIEVNRESTETVEAYEIEESEGEEKGNDELRKRIEEFIEQVNRGWKAEKLAELRFRPLNASRLDP